MQSHAHQNPSRRFFLALGVTALALVLAAPTASAAPKTKLISQSTGGEHANGEVDARGIDATGNLVLFDAHATNLHPKDTDGSRDIYVRKVAKHKTGIVSLGQSGNSGNDHSEHANISPNGRYVVFASMATDLIKGKTMPPWQIYLRDRATGTTSLVSRSSAGIRANGPCEEPAVSNSGRYVAFMARATNLTSKNTYSEWQIYLRDQKLKKTYLVSRNGAGKAGKGSSYNTEISADGRFVVFVSQAQNLVSKDTKGETQVYLYDHSTRKTSLVSKNAKGKAGNGYSGEPAISDDGRVIVFMSEANNIIKWGKDTNGDRDIFKRDRRTGAMSRVSRTWDGKQMNGDSERPDISADGRYIAFQSYATNAIKSGAPGTFELAYRRDLKTGKTKLVARSTDGAMADGRSENPRISGNGQYVAFTSKATNLIPGDDDDWDVFRRGPF